MEGNSWVGKMDSARGFVMVKGGDRWKTEKRPRKERLAAEGLWNNEMPGSEKTKFVLVEKNTNASKGPKKA